MKQEKLPIGGASNRANAGAKYETCIAAWCMVHLICKESIPQTLGRPTRVLLQANSIAKKLDDVAVELDFGGKITTLLIQCKTTLTFTASDKEFSESILAIVDRIKNGANENERYAPCYQQGSINNADDLKRLILIAEGTQNSEEWKGRIAGDSGANRMFNTLKNILEKYSVDEPIQILHTLCRQLSVLYTQVYGSHLDDIDKTLYMLRDWVQGSPDNRQLFWKLLIAIASEMAEPQQSITRLELVSRSELKSLYKDLSSERKLTKVFADQQLDTEIERANQLLVQVRDGFAYESLVEAEAKLAKIFLQHGIQFDYTSNSKLITLLRILKLVQGRAIITMEFSSEFTRWATEAKTLNPNEELWSTIGRIAYSQKDKDLLREALEHLNDPNLATLSRARLSLLEEDRELGWQYLEMLTGQFAIDAWAVKLEFVARNDNSEQENLEEAIALSEEYYKLVPERAIAGLVFVSSVCRLVIPDNSATYRLGTKYTNNSFGERLRRAHETAMLIYSGPYGVYEKNLAFGFLSWTTAALRLDGIPSNPIMECYPPFLSRVQGNRTLGISISLIKFGRKIEARRALNEKLTNEIDDEIRGCLQDTLDHLDDKYNLPLDKYGTHPWIYRGELYSRATSGKLQSALEISEGLMNYSDDTAFRIEAKIVHQLLRHDFKVLESVEELVRNYPYALDCLNNLIDFIKGRIADSNTQNLGGFNVSEEHSFDWTESSCFIILCQHTFSILPSGHVLTEWFNHCLAHRIYTPIEQAERDCMKWNFGHIHALASAWISADAGNYVLAASLIKTYSDEVPLSPYLSSFRDHVSLRCGYLQELIDRKQVLLNDKDRLPSTVRHTVQALILAGHISEAVLLAKDNMEDFPDDREAMRDFIFTAVTHGRLDLAPDSLRVFSQRFPDDKYIWHLPEEEGLNLITEQQSNWFSDQRDYEMLNLPLHRLNSNFSETWFRQLRHPAGIQSHRLGIFGVEAESLNKENSILLDLTALLAISRYDLWEYLDSYNVQTTSCNISILHRELDYHKVCFNKDRFEKCSRYKDITTCPKVQFYKQLPEEYFPKGEDVSLGDCERILYSTLSVPYISSQANGFAHTLNDLLFTLKVRGIIRSTTYKKWLNLLGEPALLEPKEIAGGISTVMFDDIELRKISDAKIWEDFEKLFEKIILGPVTAFHFDVTIEPILFNKSFIDSLDSYIAKIDAATSNNTLKIIDQHGSHLSDYAYYENLGTLASDFDLFWCDDSMVRSFVAYKSSRPTVSTPLACHLLFDNKTIDKSIYFDIIAELGSDGYRDFVHDNILIASAESVNFEPSPILRRCAFHLGRSFNLSALRDENESQYECELVLKQFLEFAKLIPPSKMNSLSQVVEAICQGAETLGGRIFWTRAIPVFSNQPDFVRQLSIIETICSSMQQLDLNLVIEWTNEMLREKNKPRVLAFPSLSTYFQTL